jgi:hypothetical protein
MVYPTIANPRPTTLSTYGGLDFTKLQQYFSGWDIGAADETNKPTINTETRFTSEKFQLFGSGSGSNQKIIFKTPAITSQRKVSFPLGLSNAEDNEFTFNKVPQVLEAKFIDAQTNSISNLANANIATGALIDWVKINKAGSTLGDISNIDLTGRTNNSSIRWDATQNKWVIFTPSTGLDVQLANLVDVILNTPVAGQLLEYNGTSWTNVNSPQVSSISKGVYTESGDGIKKVFTFPHGSVGAAPNVGFAFARSRDAIGAYATDVDDDNVIVTYQNPPPPGTNNLVWSWMVSDPFGSADNGIDVTKIVKYNAPTTYAAGNDQVFPTGNFKLTNNGFKSTITTPTLSSDITHIMPDTNQNILGRTTIDTLLNKTLVTPRIDSLANSGGTVTLPAGPTNVMGNDTTDRQYNKTINVSDNNTITGLLDAAISNSAAIAWAKINKAGSALSDLANIIISSPTSGQLLQYNGTNWVNATVSSSGEANTASNQGAGAGWFKVKSAADLQFKSFLVGDTKLSITNNTNDLTLSIVPANILLSTLGGSLLWTQVSKTGALLTDFGGSVDASRIAADAVTTVKILDGSVTLSKHAANSVDASKIVDGSISNLEINAAAAIQWSKISKTGSVLSDMANVILTTPVSGQILTYNGTNWVNQTPAASSGGVSPVSNAKWGIVEAPGPTGTAIGTGICRGWKTDALTSGNVSIDSDADGFYYSLNTTSTSQTNAEINSATAVNFRGDLNPKIEMKVKFPNVANNRWCMVFTDTIALAENTFNFLNSKNGFGLRFDTSNSGETTWQMINNNNGSTQLVTDTTVTPVNNTVYLITIQYNSVAGTVSTTVNGVTKTASTQVPTSSTEMGFVCRMQTTTPAVRNMFVYYINVTLDK